MRHRVADLHLTTRVQHREARREPGPGRRPVEPPRRDDDGVPRDLADALPRLGDLHDADARDLRVLGMHARELLARRLADPLAGEREIAGLVRLDREAERTGVRDRVPHAAVGDVDRDRAEPGDLERRVEAVGEARHVRELDRLAAPVPARGACLDDAARRLEADDRLGLAHLEHARLEQHGRGADRVRPGHRRVLRRLHDDEAGVAVGACRGHDEVDVARDAAARLAQQQPPEPVAVPLQRLHLLEHRGAGGRKDAAGDDVADLASGMAADDRQRAACAHRSYELCAIGVGVEQIAPIARLSKPHADQPARAVRIVVDELGRVDDCLVDLAHLARQRRHDAGHRLDRLELAVLLPRGHLLADLRGQEHHDIAQRVLRVPGDAERRVVAVDARPVVGGVVEEVVRVALVCWHAVSHDSLR